MEEILSAQVLEETINNNVIIIISDDDNVKKKFVCPRCPNDYRYYYFATSFPSLV